MSSTPSFSASIPLVTPPNAIENVTISPFESTAHSSPSPVSNSSQSQSIASESATNQVVSPTNQSMSPSPSPSPSPPAVTNQHPMITRAKTGSLKPRILLANVEPNSIREALAHPAWKAAMQAEFDALQKNDTWSLVELPPHRSAIGCKWVFRVKENADGSINKYKARLVAKGFHQQHGFDFNETFSPVVKPVTIRLILTLALTYRWNLQQIDVNNAFLNGFLDEEIYMTQPPGFISENKHLVCKLHRALYGLKQAPRAWYERLHGALLQFGLKPSRCDPSLFTLSQAGQKLFVLVYVDDIIITRSSDSLIHELITKLNAKFALKQLGDLDYFLGLEVKKQPDGSLFLTQTKYIRELLDKAHMAEAKPISSPMVTHSKLSKYGNDDLADPHLYRSVVGALQYATLTRPEIAYSVNKVCQFMAQPLESHWKAIKRILRYLKGTLSLGLHLAPAPATDHFSLVAFSDADWGSDPDDRRSTSGFCIYFGENLVSWSSKKQVLVARSSIEAEYRSMALATSEILWIESLLRELEVPFAKRILHCDNLSAVSLSHNPVLHARTKHMELDVHFLREKVVPQALSVVHVPAAAQVADIFTKPLASTQFCALRNKLNVCSSTPTP